MQMWQYQFMQHAFEAGTLVSLMAGVVGYFVIVRRSAFAAHALSHAGFAGAAGAVLLGTLPAFTGSFFGQPIFGLLAFTIGGGVAMALMGRKASQRDTQIGIVLAFMLGLGVLFISLYKGYATQAYSILFGEILGIDAYYVELTVVATILTLTLVAILYRPLLFSSLDQEVAEAKGLPVLWLGVLFMVLLAIAASFAVSVVGILLIFSLMVTPAAAAQHLARTPRRAIIISVAIALGATWTGLFVGFYEDYPVSFFITSIVFTVYVLVRVFHRKLENPFGQSA
jgi:zinc/manganese transport system permease protein